MDSAPSCATIGCSRSTKAITLNPAQAIQLRCRSLMNQPDRSPASGSTARASQRSHIDAIATSASRLTASIITTPVVPDAKGVPLPVSRSSASPPVLAARCSCDQVHAGRRPAHSTETSACSVSSGPTSPLPQPASPYPSAGGMSIVRWPSTAMPAMPVRNPAISRRSLRATTSGKSWLGEGTGVWSPATSRSTSSATHVASSTCAPCPATSETIVNESEPARACDRAGAWRC